MQLREALSRTVAAEVHVPYDIVAKEIGDEKTKELALATFGQTEKTRTHRNMSTRAAEPTGKVMSTFNRQELLAALEKGTDGNQRGANKGVTKREE